ncbi:respiratory nitrate reductase subunit gamma [Lactococcus termiticola]|uniref:Nitrate reductase gamma subunit n=1 Tax=Lactococcus termiticola TaxID=2169526 RepID=A0A2R5HFW7_9LACT|nr:respiratory nitrate reductase subunit gamma [Lactococcus termiticola]GBG96726.1 nitrate reductase gamma subunit [Lactococcus termiticola]
MANFGSFLLWVVFPYAMMLSFVFGTIWRMRKPGSVTAKSSELMEKKTLIWGSILFHLGLLGVLGGHIIGIFIPESWTQAIGISNEIYHKVLALGFGGVFGVMLLIGVITLAYRRFSNPRVFATSSINDNIVIIALTITIVLGMLSSFWAGPMTPGFDYRTTISIWGRTLFVLHPQYELMANIPLFYKLHIICGFAMFGFFPYTRLVHALYVPMQYLTRRFVVYRRYPGKNF